MEKQSSIKTEEVNLNGHTTEEQKISLDSLSNRPFGEKVEVPDLTGKKLVIADVELTEGSEGLTKRSNKIVRSVLLKLHFDDGNVTNVGGLQQFKQDDGSFGDVTVWKDGNSAAAKLLKLWLKKAGVEYEKASIRDFLRGLVGCVALLEFKTKEYDGREFKKNVVVDLE